MGYAGGATHEDGDEVGREGGEGSVVGADGGEGDHLGGCGELDSKVGRKIGGGGGVEVVE